MWRHVTLWIVLAAGSFITADRLHQQTDTSHTAWAGGGSIADSAARGEVHRSLLEDAPEAEHPRAGKGRAQRVDFPQHCRCPRNLKEAEAKLGTVEGVHGKPPLQQRSLATPICTFNDTVAGDGQPSSAAGKESRGDFYRSVRSVCQLRKKVIWHRRRLHCEFLKLVESLPQKANPITEVKKYKKKHFGQFIADKSKECEKYTRPAGGAPFKSASKQTLKRQEAEMIKAKALVESMPAVAVLQSARHLLLRKVPDVRGLFFKRGDEAQVEEEMSGRRERSEHLRAALRFLPEEVPPMEYATCAVVGNAGVVKLFNHGKLIDNHDLVIRINQGPDGRPANGKNSEVFRKHVGARTDLRILNRKWTELYSSRYAFLVNRDPESVTYLASRADPKYITFLGRRLNGTSAPRKFLWMNKAIVSEGMALLQAAREGLQEGLGVKFDGGFSPSSGFLALHTALHMCKEVNVFGFTIGNCYGACLNRNDYHYFDKEDVPDRELTWNHKAHSFGLEGYVLKAMHVLGILCIVPPPAGHGTCGGRLDGLLDTIGLQGTAAESPRVDFKGLLHNRTLLARLSTFPAGLDPLKYLTGSPPKRIKRDAELLEDPAALRQPPPPSAPEARVVASGVRLSRAVPSWSPRVSRREPRQKRYRIRLPAGR